MWSRRIPLSKFRFCFTFTRASGCRGATRRRSNLLYVTSSVHVLRVKGGIRWPRPSTPMVPAIATRASRPEVMGVAQQGEGQVAAVSVPATGTSYMLSYYSHKMLMLIWPHIGGCSRQEKCQIPPPNNLTFQVRCCCMKVFVTPGV